MAIDSDSAYLVDQDGVGVTKDGSDDIAVLFQGGDSVPVHSAPLNTYYYRTNKEVYIQVDSPSGSNWELQVSATVDNNIDGGFANSVYLPDQCFDGGGA